jgi:hypothetical protein
MKSLHYEYSNLGPEDVLEITLDARATVQLLDEANYQRYCGGESFTYHGGLVTKSPCPLSPPRFGKWHLVIDFEEIDREVIASVRLIQFCGESVVCP